MGLSKDHTLIPIQKTTANILKAIKKKTHTKSYDSTIRQILFVYSFSEDMKVKEIVKSG